MTNKIKTYLLVGISVAAFVSMLSISPIRQDPAFHNFADGREIASIPNFMNVISNLPFMLFGITDLWMIKKSRPLGVFEELRMSCALFFVGIFFTGIGSAFYHLHPDNSTLVWDRLPMTISFMAFFSVLTGTMITIEFGKKILWPLIIFGILSVWHWMIYDDLRLYAIVQFLPIVLTPIILILFSNNKISRNNFWLMILVYAIAKLFETLDYETYFSLGTISGHSIKHLFAATVPAIFIFGLYNTRTITKSP